MQKNESINYLPRAQFAKHRNAIDAIIHAAYPEFLLHDAISTLYWNKLFTHFTSFQLILMLRRKVRAIGNSVPLYCNDYTNFKVDGWDWALQEANAQLEKQVKPNALVGLSVAVAGDSQGKGYSQELLLQFKTVAKESGFRKLIIPIRPINKHLYPLMNFEEYVNATLNGKSLDPWIRTHEKLGAKRICICTNAMTIQGTINEWEEWTKLKFPKSGQYHIAGGLVPVEIDLGNNSGIYIEPNLWMEYVI